MRNRPFTLVELDVPVCSLTYGTAPCTASVPTTGAQKCFNTIRTCQDRENFARSTKTLRVCMPSEDIPLAYDALPNLSGVNVTPGVIDPGNSIGIRASVKVTCVEHPSSDAIFDKYLPDRTYTPFNQGTFWAKLRARVPALQGMALRVLRGQFGEDLSTYLVAHYVVESAVIDADGISITAKDALSYCDPSKAQCPVLSLGRLSLNLTAVATSLTLVPPGIGDDSYPASGYGCLSGKEIVPFTRIADSVTITRTGAFGTLVQAHDSDSIFQVVQVFNAESAADIVYSLLVDFTPGIDAAWCDLASWQAEADTYIGHLYTAPIPAPTAVKVLLDEMMQQAGCSLWWDPIAQRVRFQTLRPVAPGAYVFDDDRILAGSFQAQDQPDKRISEAWTYYGLADATNKVDKESNFKAAVAKVDPDASVDYDVPAYKKNLARWITIDNRPAAERLNAMQLARFRDAPRRAKMSLTADALVIPELGTGIQVRAFSMQEADGSLATVPFYVTSIDKDEATVSMELEELHFTEPADETERAVFIDVDRFNVNLRTLYDSLYASVPDAATITFIVSPGAYVGAQTFLPAIDVGTWPGDTVLILEIASVTSTDSQVLGRGGNGAGYPPGDEDGEAGSTALYTRRPLTLRNYGTIGGGGGGGQLRGGLPEPGSFFASGGGGGAGFNRISGGIRLGGEGGRGGTVGVRHGHDGTTTTGGAPGVSPEGPGGRGGNIAEGGYTIDNGPGHSDPGVAIDGASYITFAIAGTILGSQIN